MEGGGIRIPVRRRSRGSPARPARVRRAAGRVGAGGPARAVRDADAEHRGRADRGGALAGQVAGTPDEQAVALRDAMRVLFPEAVALVSAARQGFMREIAPPLARRCAVSVARPRDRPRSCRPCRGRLVRRLSARVHRRAVARRRRCASSAPERRGEARDDRRARRGDPERRGGGARSRGPTTTCSRGSTPSGSTRTSRSSSTRARARARTASCAARRHVEALACADAAARAASFVRIDMEDSSTTDATLAYRELRVARLRPSGALGASGAGARRRARPRGRLSGSTSPCAGRTVRVLAPALCRELRRSRRRVAGDLVRRARTVTFEPARRGSGR